MLKKVELKETEFEYLFEYSREKDIVFLSSPFDVDSVKFLEKLGVVGFKIASGEIVNPRLLSAIGKTRKPVIMSSGMATLGDIEYGISTLRSNGTNDIALLHCFTSYPAPFEKINLRAIHTLKQAFKTPVGYSDHTLGIYAPLIAVAVGAELIEKHFTLDRSMPGPDHRASLDPQELKEMIHWIRKTEKALGDGVKVPATEELEVMKVARKSIVSARTIRKGETINTFDLEFKRPGDGIDPRRSRYLEQPGGSSAPNARGSVRPP